MKYVRHISIFIFVWMFVGFAEPMKRYCSEEYTFQIDLPANMEKIDIPMYMTAFVAGSMDILASDYMMIVMSSMEPVTIDSSTLKSLTEELQTLEKDFPGMILRYPELTIIGETNGIVYEQKNIFMPNMGFDICIVVLASDISQTLFLAYYLRTADKNNMLPVIESSYQTLKLTAQVEPIKQYVNTKYGYKFDIPKSVRKADDLVLNMTAVITPQLVDLLLNENMVIMIQSYPPETIDTNFIIRSKEALKESETYRYPELITVGGRAAVILEQKIVSPTGSEFDYCVSIMTSDTSKMIILNYYVRSADKVRMLQVIKNSYQTLELIAPVESLIESGGVYDSVTPSMIENLNQALRVTYNQHSWDRAQLYKVMMKIDDLVDLPYDFLNPSDDIVNLANEDTSDTWRIFLNIFHKRNFLQWYPTRMKKARLSAQSFGRVLTTSKPILCTKVTMDVWRNIDYDMGTKCKCTIQSNLASGLTVSEIASLIDYIDVKKSGIITGPYIDYRILSVMDFSIFKMVTGKDLVLAWPEHPTSEDHLFLMLSTLAIYDVKTRLERHDEIMKESMENLVVDVFIHRNQQSFAKAGGNTRSYVDTVNGKCIVHVKVPDSLLGYEEAVFRMLHSGEEGVPFVQFHEYENINDELLTRLQYLSADLSATVSHELDHALYVRGEHKPRWLAEGQATYFGEILNELNRSGIERALRIDNQSNISEEIGDSAFVTRYMQTIRENMFPTKREQHWKNLIIDRKSGLIDDFENLVLTLDRNFYKEDINYGLAWALFKTVTYASSHRSADWVKYKAHWDDLISLPYSELHNAVIKGQFRSFFEWLISIIGEAL